MARRRRPIDPIQTRRPFGPRSQPLQDPHIALCRGFARRRVAVERPAVRWSASGAVMNQEAVRRDRRQGRWLGVDLGGRDPQRAGPHPGLLEFHIRPLRSPDAPPGHRCRRRCDRRGRCWRRRAGRARRLGRQQHTRDDRSRDALEASSETSSEHAAGNGPPDLGSGSCPHVPRRRRPSRGRSLPRALRLSRGIRGPDPLARPARIPRRDAARGPVALAAGNAPARASGGRQLRRRLPQPGGDRGPDPREPRLARRDQPHRQEHDGLLGAATRPGTTADRGRLGGGLPLRDPSRPEEDRRRGAASGSSGLADDAAEAAPRPCRVLLLPRRQARRPCGRSGAGGGVQRCHDDRSSESRSRPTCSGWRASASIGATAWTGSSPSCGRSGLSLPVRAGLRRRART